MMNWSADIKELLSYEENSAGALMAKELVKVYETWTVAGLFKKNKGPKQKRLPGFILFTWLTKKKNSLEGFPLKDLIVAKNEQKIA
jgi:magnesium transporter